MKRFYFILLLSLFFIHIKSFSQNEFSKKSYLFADSLFVEKMDISNSKKYIDSTIYYAEKDGTDKQLAFAYSSIGFFFNKIQAFDKSLYYFEKSNDYAERINNNYIKYSNYYGVSLIYFQLGNLKESKQYLLECYNYFVINQKTQSNKLALINVLDRLAFIELINGNFDKSKFYNNLEFTYTNNKIIKENFPNTEAYALKNKGIILYREKEYNESINYLNKAIPHLIKKNNSYWLSIAYSYLGDNYMALNDNNKAYEYYLKVDSIYKKTKITDPFLRHGLEKINLLNKKNHSIYEQLKSTNTLIEFDSLHNLRNTNLSNKFYGEFINKDLNKERNNLQRKIILKDRSFSIIIGLVIIIGGVIFFKIKKKQKKEKQNFQKTINKYISEIQNIKENNGSNIKKVVEKPEELKLPKKSSEDFIDDDTINNIISKLDILESEDYFINTNINLRDTANKINTNTNYLSFAINTKKGCNFPSYINTVRINYIIKQIIENKKVRNMSMDGIANTAGFKTRQKFSDTFLEKTGMRPSYFISNIDKIDIDKYLN